MRKHPLLFLAFFLIAFPCWNGCTTSRVIENTRVPEITVDESGAVTFNGKRVPPGKIADALHDGGITHEQEVNILIPDKPDRPLMRTISAELLHGGYTRTVFVKNRKAISTAGKQPPPSPETQVLPYKRAAPTTQQNHERKR